MNEQTSPAPQVRELPDEPGHWTREESGHDIIVARSRSAPRLNYAGFKSGRFCYGWTLGDDCPLPRGGWTKAGAEAERGEADELKRLAAFLIANESLWPCMSGSPVDVAIGVLMWFKTETTARKAAEAERDAERERNRILRGQFDAKGYVPQEVVAELSGFLATVWKDEPGKANTLWAKVRDVCAAIAAERTARERAEGALREFQRAMRDGDKPELLRLIRALESADAALAAPAAPLAAEPAGQVVRESEVRE